MNCKTAQKKIKAYLDDELFHDEREAVKEHLKNCLECAQEADRLSQTWAVLLKLPREGDIPDLIPSVLDHISQQEQKPFLGRIIEWASNCKSSFATATAFAMIIGFVLGAGIANSLSTDYQNRELAGDPLYLDLFSDVPDSSITSAYISFIYEEGEGL
jgi:predicted anti-sigma-YlaC factor YlaD